MNLPKDNARGFTLVELLVVISIIAILAGISLTIINPQKQQAKAQEVMMRSNLAKICMALNGCGALKNGPRECESWNALGVNDPTGKPVGSGYYVWGVGNANIAYWYGYQGGKGSNCYYLCNYDFSTGTSDGPNYWQGTCLSTQ